MVQSGNLFAGLGRKLVDEDVTILAKSPGAQVERIVSTGQASPPGFWYDQDNTEWVLLIAGSACLLFEGEAGSRELRPGDYVEIAAHRRHRVEWTAPDQPTVWLVVHLAPE